MESQTRRAETLLDMGRPREALDALRSAPPELQVLALRARCHLRLGDPQEALRQAEAMIVAAPEDEWGHRLRAIAWMRLGRPREALEAIRQAHRLDPENLHSLHLLAALLVDAKKRKEAQRVSDRLLSVAPDWAVAHTTAADVALARKKWADAEAHARQALALDPESKDAQENLALALQRRRGRKHQREALEILYRNFQRNPDDPYARDTLMEAIDAHFQVPMVYYFFVGLLFPGLYLWALGHLLWANLVSPLRFRKVSHGLRDLIRQRRRARRGELLWQVVIFLSLPTAIVTTVLVLIEPSVWDGWDIWAWLFGSWVALAVGVFRFLRLTQRKEWLLHDPILDPIRRRRAWRIGAGVSLLLAVIWTALLLTDPDAEHHSTAWPLCIGAWLVGALALWRLRVLRQRFPHI